jgi:hypothetical protein
VTVSGFLVGTVRSAVPETQRSAGVSELRGHGDGPTLAAADIAARCPHLEPRKVTNLNQDLTTTELQRAALN